LMRLAVAGSADAAIAALLDLHGAISSDRTAALAGALATGPETPTRSGSPRLVVAPDVIAALSDTSRQLAASTPTTAELRAGLAARLRRLVFTDRGDSPLTAAAVDRVVDALIDQGEIERDGDRIRLSQPADARETATHARAAALDGLVALLDVDVPPSLGEAARAAGCPLDGIVALARSGRIVRVEDDLAWSAARYEALRDRALELARGGPLLPAAFRDAIGGNRRVALALLEDLGRKGILRRTDAGHVPGPRAPSSV
jgi:hypothetical protein